MRAYVALLLVHLRFPYAQNLKAKRKELQSVKAQLRGRHGLTVAEVDYHDTWQRSTLAAALTGGSLATLEATTDGIERWLESRFPENVHIERIVSSFDEVGELR